LHFGEATLAGLPTATVVSHPAPDSRSLESRAGSALPKREPSLLARTFTEHPRSIGETYLQHGMTALGFALRLLGAGLAGLVHALVPCLFSRTVSVTIDSLHKQMLARSLRQNRDLSHEMPRTGPNQ